MRIFTILLAFVSLFSFSCKKENHSGNGNSNGEDTSALTKFVNATGITDATVKVNLDSLVTRARRHGWWNSCKVIYPFAGGTSTTCKYNLKDPRDSDSAFRLTFVNNPTFSSGGVDWNGTSQYADTHLNPSTDLTADDGHISYYSVENDTTSPCDIGAQTLDTTTQRIAMQIILSNQVTIGMYDNSTSGIAVPNTDARGFFMASRTTSTLLTAYKNGSPLASSTGPAGTQPNANIFIGATSNGTGVLGYGTNKCAFVTIGSGISSTIAALMYSDISDFVENK